MMRMVMNNSNFVNQKNKELDEALQILSIVAEKDKSELKRYTEGKVDVLESKLKTVRKIVNKYSDIEEED